MKFTLKIAGRQRTFSTGNDTVANAKKATELAALVGAPILTLGLVGFAFAKLRG